MSPQEHGLDESGKYIPGSGDEDQQLKRLSVYFQEVGGSQNKYVPRSIQADLEPAVINKIKSGRLSKLFRPDTFIHVSRDDRFVSRRSLADHSIVIS